MYIVIACDKISCRQFWILRFKNKEIIKIFPEICEKMTKFDGFTFLPQNNCLGVVSDNIFIMYIVLVRNEAMLLARLYF